MHTAAYAIGSVVVCLVTILVVQKLTTFLTNVVTLYKKRNKKKDWVSAAAVLGQPPADDWLPEVTCGIPSLQGERVQIAKTSDADYWTLHQAQVVHPTYVVNLRQK